MSYWVWDPGETTGFATFNESGTPIGMGTVKYGKPLNDLLDTVTLGIDFFVVEQFQLRTKNNFGRQKHYTPEWNPVITARAIGAIERRAHELGIDVKWQYPSQLGAASQAFGLSLTKFRSAQHSIDAVLHGLLYAWKHLGLIPPEHPERPAEEEAPRTVVVQPVSGLGDLRKAFRRAEAQRKRES